MIIMDKTGVVYSFAYVSILQWRLDEFDVYTCSGRRLKTIRIAVYGCVRIFKEKIIYIKKNMKYYHWN